MIRRFRKNERNKAGADAATAVASDHAVAESVGALDARAGVPHPLAESRDDARQPVARLYRLHADAVTRIEMARGAALTGLNEIRRLHGALPTMIGRAAAEMAALQHALEQAERGRERWLARWRISAIVGGLAIGLPAEVYLTTLSLNFLDVPDAWAQRFLAVGIAIALALVALVAANGEQESEKWMRQLALAVSAALLLGLALLRWGVTPNASWLEEAGALLVMAVAAFAFVIWTIFVKRRVEHAVGEHSQWQAWMLLEHDFRSARAQHDLYVELSEGLPAEVENHKDNGVTEVRVAQSGFRAAAAGWWADNQAENAAASPDIRTQLDELKQELEGHVLTATADLDDRAVALRTLMAGDDKETE